MREQQYERYSESDSRYEYGIFDYCIIITVVGWLIYKFGPELYTLFIAR
jgi:hypothetical protein